MVNLKHKSVTILLHMENHGKSLLSDLKTWTSSPFRPSPPLPYSKIYLMLLVFLPTTQIIFMVLPGVVFKLQSGMRHSIYYHSSVSLPILLHSTSRASNISQFTALSGPVYFVLSSTLFSLFIIDDT